MSGTDIRAEMMTRLTAYLKGRQSLQGILGWGGRV